MDNCRKYREWIGVLLDGELSGDDEGALRAHLGSCTECRRVYDAYRALSEALSEDLAEPPELLKYSVMSRIAAAEKTENGNRRRFSPVRIAALAACMALILFAGFHMDLWNIKNADVSASAADSAMSAAGELGGAETTAETPQYSFTSGSSPEDRAEAGERSSDESVPTAAPTPAPEPSAGTNEEAVQDGTVDAVFAATPAPSPAAPPASEIPASESDGTDTGGDTNGFRITGSKDCSYTHVLILAGDSTLLDSSDPALLLNLTANILVPGAASGEMPDRTPDYSVELTREDTEEALVCLVWLQDDALWWSAENDKEATLSPAPASAFLDLLPPAE